MQIQDVLDQVVTEHGYLEISKGHYTLPLPLDTPLNVRYLTMLGIHDTEFGPSRRRRGVTRVDG